MSQTTPDRVLAVLSLFSVDRPEWTVEECASSLGCPISTTYRYVRSLTRAGMLVAVETGRYVLGPTIIRFDRQIRLSDPLLHVAEPIMREMIRDLAPGSVCMICRLYRDEVICVHQEHASGRELLVSYERGRPMPLFRGAASKIILANLPLRDVRRLFDTVPGAQDANVLGADWEEAKRRLRRLRSAGVSVTRGEVDPGLVGVSAGLFGLNGEVIGSIGFVVEEASLRLEDEIELLRRAAIGAGDVQTAFREERAAKHKADNS